VISRADPALVHLHSSKAGLAGRLAVRRALPTVFQPHAWSFDAVSGVVAGATRTWERSAVRWTDLIVAVSSEEQARGERAGVRAAYVVAPNGVDVERLQPSDIRPARDRLGLGAGPLAVCVGRLARQKGQDMLVAGWPTVREVVPDARLLLVGDGPDRTHLETIRGEGVELVGGVEDPSLWYAAADVVVMPSRWEGMALVPLEAMACGRSVVTFAVAGVRESLGVDDSGSSPAGAVVPEGQPEALLAAVAARLADPAAAAREGLAGRARVTKLFDVRRTAHDLTDRVAPLLRDA
jgi:glycosyltransferase involved in cell wall biosynthesis